MVNAERKDIRWKEWNADGFIPGPDETESEFEKRIQFCQNLTQNLVQETGVGLPFDVSDEAPKSILEEAFPKTRDLFGIAPSWVPLFFSNHQLTPWHGGCAWIFQLNENTPTAAFMQLRRSFRSSTSHYKIFHRDEILSHELAHVGRMVYQEPQFEELLAYQTSTSRLRRWLGPIVQSSQESVYFVLILACVVMMDFALLWAGPGMETLTWWIKAIPILLILLGLIRLAYRHHCVKRCLEQLKGLYEPKIAKHVLYRLRDSEIKVFARLSPSQIKEYIETTSHKSFRWQFLKNVYPPK